MHWWKAATARSFRLNRDSMTEIMPATHTWNQDGVQCFHSIKAVINQVGTLQMGLRTCWV